MVARIANALSSGAPIGRILIRRIIMCIVNPVEFSNPTDRNYKFTSADVWAFVSSLANLTCPHVPLNMDDHDYGRHVMFNAAHDPFAIDFDPPDLFDGRFHLFNLITGGLHYTQTTTRHVCPDDKFIMGVASPILVTKEYVIDMFNRDKGEFYTIVTTFPDEVMALFA